MSKNQSKSSHLQSAPQFIKIIGGHWRGTKLRVLLNDTIRPTPARVRETLFNWLQAYIAGSHCLDLFAGSGALGFESISRGAKFTSFVDIDPQVTEILHQQLIQLQSSDGEAICMDGLKYLENCEKKFDIIYIDPPFSMFNLEDVLDNLKASKVVKPGGLVYVESALNELPQNLPIDWKWKRQSKASQVEYGLITTD